ncbi:Sensory/regulatory protein RpfC [Polystyrenella longa]|uniref:Sensor protein FixL n=1 Tax=Polystyrenella longa TaxID=2528007 RepID=A0A518CJQ9_9PLAN|nr:PAS domain S-box protein [Polystyrenella longa]QDU79465.1 Sensory/regulatory protein RpfC [Polystyrenella longa]
MNTGIDLTKRLETAFDSNVSLANRSNIEIESLIDDVSKMLRNGQSKVNAILETAVDAVIMINQFGIVSDFNPAAERMFGYQPEEVVGQNIKMLMPSPYQEQHDGYLHNYMSTGEKKVIGIGREVQAKRKDGSVFDIELAVSELTLNGQNYFAGIIKDISERKQNERHLNWLATIVESSNEAIIGIDQGLKIHSWNKAAETIFGYDVEEAQEECISLLFAEEEQIELLILLQEIADGKIDRTRLETHGINKRGLEIDLSLSIAPIIENDHHISGTSIIATDITQSREIERQMERTRALAQYTLNSLNECIAILDQDGMILSVNSAWQEFVEEMQFFDEHLKEQSCFYPSAELEHDQLWDAQLQIAGQIQDLFKDDNEVEMDQFIVSDNSGERCFCIKLARFLEQEESRVVVAIDDITAEKQAHQEIEKAARAAHMANVAKTDFLTNMSHEIRTPLTAILGFAELMLEEDMDKEEQDLALQTVRRNGEHLLGIINEILDLSKIESGKLEVEHSDCDVIKLIDDLHDIMNLRAEKQNLNFTTEFATALPAIIETDSIRLKQVLFNLLGNALKFTSEGKVHLSIGSECGSSGQLRMRFEVTDSGIGIDPQSTTRLFEPFTQADNSVSRKYGGTGLGLAISKRLVGLLGGEIGVNSIPGKGSTFWFTIDCGIPAGFNTYSSLEEYRDGIQTRQEESLDVEQLDCSILLAEDGEDNRHLFDFILSQAGVRLTTVSNGAEAVKKAIDPSNQFDIILMDMQMPVMDGYLATKILRESGYNGPILALTAHAVKSMQQRSLNAGCDDIITKPVNRKKLLSILNRWDQKSFQLN